MGLRRLRGALALAFSILFYTTFQPSAVVVATDQRAKEGSGADVGNKALALIIGSVNVDITIDVDRLPTREETITAASGSQTRVTTGGKGANQAIALARLSDPNQTEVAFVGVFGSDFHAHSLRSALLDAGVNLDGSDFFESPLQSGTGYVLLEGDGTATSIVVQGSNGDWFRKGKQQVYEHLSKLVASASVVLLQREVPEEVNAMVLRAASEADNGVPVVLDVGGEDRDLEDQSLALLSVICPNESELQRLTKLPVGTDEEVILAAKALQYRGARDVLVTLGERGMILVRKDGSVVHQEALEVPGGVVVDATGAGDTARAAFAVFSILEESEGRGKEEELRMAAAAGAIAVSKAGAVPSLPSREDTFAYLNIHPNGNLENGDIQRQKKRGSSPLSFIGRWLGSLKEGLFERCSRAIWGERAKLQQRLKFASRLNSMKHFLGGGEESSSVLNLLQLQAQITGLTHVHLNYPQHFAGSSVSVEDVSSKLQVLGLKPGAICMRYPLEDFALGALTNPSRAVRQKAVRLTIEACQVARQMGAKEVVVWPQADGYDYYFQIDYLDAWDRAVDSFREICDVCGQDIKVSLEWKPTDQVSRFSVVGSTAAALLLISEVKRKNFGLTLDLGHSLMAGENPAQSVAMATRAGKLFGVQFNDMYQRTGAEDGLAVASVNPRMVLEVVHWLRRADWDGICYFDTFPMNENPVREGEMNIRTITKMWQKAGELFKSRRLSEYQAKHDAMSIMEMLEKDEL